MLECKRERRDSARIPYRVSIFDRLYTPDHLAKLDFFYLNISARGLCGFFLGKSLPKKDEVLYLIRKNGIHVLYKVCWISKVLDSSYRFGLNLISSDDACNQEIEEINQLEKDIALDHQNEMQVLRHCI